MRQPFAPPHRPAGASPAGVPSAARRGSKSATSFVGARIKSHAAAARVASPNRIARPGGPIGGTGRPASKRDGAEGYPVRSGGGVSVPMAPFSPSRSHRDALKHLPQEYSAAFCVTLHCDGEFFQAPISSSRRGRGSRGAPRVGFGSRAPSALRERAGLPDVWRGGVLLHGGGLSREFLRRMLPPVGTRGGGACAPVKRLLRSRSGRQLGRASCRE